MFRLALPVLCGLSAPALAHEGLHHHPHGIEYGWVIAAALGVVGGLALAWFRGRR